MNVAILVPTILFILLFGCVSPPTQTVWTTVTLDGYATATRDQNEHYPDYVAVYFTIDVNVPDVNFPDQNIVVSNQYCGGICFDGNNWAAYSAMKETLLQLGNDRNTVSFELVPAPLTCGPYWGQICRFEIKKIK